MNKEEVNKIIENQELELILATNHRYFVRQTITTGCVILLLTICYVILLSAAPSVAGWVILLSLVYLVIVLIVVYRLTKMHADVTAAESECVEGSYYNHKLKK